MCIHGHESSHTLSVAADALELEADGAPPTTKDGIVSGNQALLNELAPVFQKAIAPLRLRQLQHQMVRCITQFMFLASRPECLPQIFLWTRARSDSLLLGLIFSFTSLSLQINKTVHQ